eukprot:TRINITY_DN29405_c0_g1_i1.p1 TRINITY_DN29405_c0_g1~~TRINITY_DN29405_c0_g1_i1.p1  ORF type:complete len:534 (+),score=173.94 TRINITY_DN29405_c0_g1_i1:107-1603(+)
MALSFSTGFAASALMPLDDVEANMRVFEAEEPEVAAAMSDDEGVSSRRRAPYMPDAYVKALRQMKEINAAFLELEAMDKVVASESPMVSPLESASKILLRHPRLQESEATSETTSCGAAESEENFVDLEPLSDDEFEEDGGYEAFEEVVSVDEEEDLLENERMLEAMFHVNEVVQWATDAIGAGRLPQEEPEEEEDGEGSLAEGGVESAELPALDASSSSSLFDVRSLVAEEMSSMQAEREPQDNEVRLLRSIVQQEAQAQQRELKRQEDEQRLRAIFLECEQRHLLDLEQVRQKAEQEAAAGPAQKKTEALAPPQSPARSRKPLVFGRIVRTPSGAELKASPARQEAFDLFARAPTSLPFSSPTKNAPGLAPVARLSTPCKLRPARPAAEAAPSAMMMDLGFEPSSARWSPAPPAASPTASPQKGLGKSRSVGAFKLAKDNKSGFTLPAISGSKSASQLPGLKASPFASRSPATSTWDVPFASGGLSKRYDLSLVGH